jgi:hypothetical protein
MMKFKKLTTENWLDHDSTCDVFIRTRENGTDEAITGNEWAKDFLKPQLNLNVPTEVRELFEVARGTCLYGYFFYPIFTLGMQQIFRVMEAAIEHKCRKLKTPAENETFSKKLKWLCDNHQFNEKQKIQWDEARKMRNFFSHEKRQSLFDPGSAIRQIQNAIDLINSLFDEKKEAR